jgi:DNA polymerase III subunit delta
MGRLATASPAKSMKLAGGAATRAAQKDAPPRFVMLSGPDGGALRRLGMDVVKRHLAADPALELKRYSEDDLRADPACVEQAISTPSLFGGAAIAFVRVNSEKDAAALASLVSFVDKGGAQPEGALIIDAGDMSKASKARKIFEDSPHAWFLLLYETTRDDLLHIARNQAQASGASIEPDALALLLETCAQDSDSVAGEVAKLALYVGNGGTIDTDAIHAVGSGGREAGIDEAIDAAFGGNKVLMATRLEQALMSGANPVGILNAVGRRIRVLLQVQAGIASGGNAVELLKNPRLGIFWKKQSDVARQASLWGRAPLEEALRATLETDRRVKRKNAPDTSLVEQLLTRIASRASATRTS